MTRGADDTDMKELAARFSVDSRYMDIAALVVSAAVYGRAS
jgi:hypothetical protein